MRLRFVLVALALALSPGLATAQGTDISLGALVVDSKLPVQVTADQLRVAQADGTATFDGNVLVIQGDMRLSADRVGVEYVLENGQPTRRIARMQAEGKVLLVNGSEAAEGQRATYDIEASTLVMTGDVLLTQGGNTVSGQSLSINLKTGAGQMQGRVKTVFSPQGGAE
ncbi:lipopolysaccharide transport periplasmic protein LptA [Actibacterium sp. XHP0104]|uniref:lipopolysaccharide transport periplasmic protein LptA n=1 Tax=Actibacterium sp. XHP0104 TaxID=2984335 RepID=UPI0021E776A8|nr:lipopolysaccharide transport periplasmic protein LptA [Actibacterium sp. XHP0104]MCV2882038.1 lipopolysaccharide transport periplasmic protein LptA [Actibacterium sp. XHP0104]